MWFKKLDQGENLGDCPGGARIRGRVPRDTDNQKKELLADSSLCEQTKVQSKLDTGAEVTVMAQDGPAMLKMTLEKPTKRLTGPEGTGLTVLGKVDSLLEVGDRRHHEAVYVVEGQQSSLLSIRACKELKLAEVSREV